MITREQVADLRPGDVVEVRGYPSLKDATTIGPLWTDGETKKLCVGPFVIRHRDGAPPTQYDDDPEFTLTVVSRAPRPLYVNHPRTEPKPGDVARVDGDDGSETTWHFLDGIGKEWFDKSGYSFGQDELPVPLRLLIDGETGQVVP